ncbi:MAG: uracil phosphoribosyltransferase [bacterium]|nr:uracil phosphoribosyltransferase [bacterium]
MQSTLTVLAGSALMHDLAIVRDASTDMTAFRGAINRIGLHLAAEVSKYLPTYGLEIDTPNERTNVSKLDGHLVLLPVLRAGLGLLEPFLTLLPHSSVGYIGLRRDEQTLEPHTYYNNVPSHAGTWTAVVLDPMLATGGSMVAALDSLALKPPTCILAAALIAAPEGVERVRKAHPNVHIVVGAMDRGLNERGFIVPGLGDAGDRLFGT